MYVYIELQEVKMEKHKLTMLIDKQMIKDLKQIALDKETTLVALITQMIKEYLKKNTK